MTIPRVLTQAAGVGAVALLALIGAGGAAGAQGGGLWLGLPSATSAAAIVVGAVALLALALRRGARTAAVAGFAVPVLLLLAGAGFAGARAVSGPPLLALAAAGLVATLPALGLSWPRRTIVPTAFALFVLSGGQASVRVGPQGDEPHYLMVADSLLRDGDVALDRDYAEGRYGSFHDAPLEPHYRVRGKHREILSLHAVGLSVLILPGWALAGYPGVTVLMALLAALLVREAHALCAALAPGTRVADATAALFALSPPLLSYAGLVFTEVPAALAVTYGLRCGLAGVRSPWRAFTIGLAAAALPWLNVRYVPLALLLVGHAVWRDSRARSAAACLLPLLASAAGIAAYHRVLYGFWDPRRVYGARPEFAWGILRDGLPGLLLDQEFGLLVYAPVLALSLPGLALWLRRDRRSGLVAIAAVLSVLLTAGSWHMWRGGFNPPGRFLVPIAPLLFAGVALVFQRRGLTAGAALLAGWGLWVGLGGALEPQLVHRDRDDTAPFFRAFSGAREWTALLPGYVLEHPDRNRLAVIWGAALLLAVPWRTRRLSTRRTAIAAAGLVAAAQLAGLVSRERTDDRDAVRLTGCPALAVPSWRFERSAVAEWVPSDLGWGPLYEPHRFPSGAELGRRLPLPPGRYRLELEARRLSNVGERPLLAWAWDRPNAPWRFEPLAGEVPEAAVDWSAPPVRRCGVDLRLRSGPPLLVERVRLQAVDR